MSDSPTVRVLRVTFDVSGTLTASVRDKGGEGVVGGDAPGQQRLDVLERVTVGQALEDELEVAVGFEAVGPSGLQQAVEVGAGLGTGLGGAEQPVLAPQGEGPDGVLGGVVGHRHLPVVEEHEQARPLVVEIAQGVTELGLGRHLGAGVVEPLA